LLILVTFLNLGGTPPFIGFYAKVAVIVTLGNRSQLIILLRLVVGSIFLLYVYLQILIKALSIGSAKVRLFEAKNRRVSGGLPAFLILGVVAVPLVLRIGVWHKKI
jgi:NADH:ubiquinone oxidoreductase subunit 2 (subunit N)